MRLRTARYARSGCRAIEWNWGIAYAGRCVAHDLLRRKELEASQRLLEEALARFRREGDLWGISLGLCGLGEVAHFRGELTTTRSYFEESLALRRQVGERMSLANAVGNVAFIAWEQGDLAAAQALAEERRAMALAVGARRFVGDSALLLGWIALTVGGWLGGTITFVHGMRVLSLADEPAAKASSPVPSPAEESAEK